MKIRPVGDELFYADGQAGARADGHDEVKSRFLRIFANALKNPSPLQSAVDYFC